MHPMVCCVVVWCIGGEEELYSQTEKRQIDRGRQEATAFL